MMYRDTTSHVQGCAGQPQPKSTINIIRLLCCGDTALSSPINSVRDVEGPDKVAAATSYYIHHELRRKQINTVITKSYLTPNIRYCLLYTSPSPRD